MVLCFRPVVLSQGFMFQASDFILLFYLMVLCFRPVILSYGFIFHIGDFISCFYVTSGGCIHGFML